MALGNFRIGWAKAATWLLGLVTAPFRRKVRPVLLCTWHCRCDDRHRHNHAGIVACGECGSSETLNSRPGCGAELRKYY